MGRRQKFSLFFVLAFFFFLPAFSMELKSPVFLDGWRWTLETTQGFQNIENSFISNSDGNETYTKQALSSKGILFHSFYNDFFLTNAQLTLGFIQHVDFLWTAQPDFFHESNLNNNLRTVEFDVQRLFPVFHSSDFSVYVFGSYSYFEISSGDSQNKNSRKKVLYNSFSGGIQGFFSFSRTFSQQGYISYSPVVVYGYRLSTVQFVNYGFEFRSDSYPISFTLFYNVKHGFHQRGKTFFDGFNKNMDSSEIGFAFHWNFKSRTTVKISED